MASFSSAACWATRARASASSRRAITWPAATFMPSRTLVASTTPETFDLTVAWASGASEPDSGRRSASSRASTVTTSFWASSKTVGLSAFLSAAAAGGAPLPFIAYQPPPASATTSSAMSGLRQRRPLRGGVLEGGADPSGKVSIFMAAVV